MSEFVLHPMMTQSCSFWQSSENDAQRERVGVVALVLALHAGLGLAWMMVPEQPAQVIKEMSVSIAMEQAPVVEEKPEPPPPKPQPKVEKTEKPLPMPVVRELAEQAPQVVPVAPPPPQVAVASPQVSAAPVPDTEPDFKASYLKNPRPAYPMVARKMGWEGRVILNVEVLAEGACGGVNVFRSSGREVLDNAAISTVKSWRFIPARHAGRAVTQWFKVPINFSLEDSEA